MCILEHLDKGCIEIYWYIPSNFVDRAYQSAKVMCYQFNDLHLHYLQIGHYPVIYDPLTLPNVTSPAPSPPDSVGKPY